MQGALKPQRGDLVAVGLVVLLAVLVLVLFLPGGRDVGQVEIYQDGVLVGTMPLEEDGERVITGKYTNVITVKDGSVFVTRSDCPGEDCVKSGKISRVGRSLVCLPNGVEIRVAGTPEGDVDFVVG